MSYAAQAAFIAPAAKRPAIWRLGVGVATALVVYIGTIAGLAGLAHLFLGEAESSLLIASIETGGTPTSTLLMLTSFVGMALGAICAAAWHLRGPLSLIGPLRRAASHFGIAFVIASGLLGASIALFLTSNDVDPGLPLTLWLWFLPFAILALLVQTGAEELLFRGYLQQQFAARFSSPMLWLILPSLVFGALHFDPSTPGLSGCLIAAAATLFGLCAADLTARTGTLGAAWGFHFANNVAAILTISLPDKTSGLSLYLTQFGFADTQIVVPMIVQDMATSLLIWLVVRWVLRPAETVRT